MSRRRSVVRSLLLAMLGTGLAMGLLFPLVVAPFAEYRTGMRPFFSALSLAAGLIVGGLNFLLARLFVLRTVQRVSGQLESLARGEGAIGSRLSLDSDDALGRLVGRFNGFVERLQESLERVLQTVEAFVAHAAESGKAAGELGERAARKGQVVAGTVTLFEGLRREQAKMRGIVERLKDAAAEAAGHVGRQVGQVEAINGRIDQLQQRHRVGVEGATRAAAALQRTGSNTEHLTRALDEAAASMTEMDFTVREIEKGLGNAAGLAERAAADSGQGDEAVQRTREAMERIRAGVGGAAESIRAFTRQAAEIAAVTDVIDEVTEQTNLLALNAAIIAAQAGSHGAGFAVVAGQIKKLADRTAASTREIGSLVEGFRTQSGAALAAMVGSQALVEEGVSLSQRAGEALGRIREGAAASHEQVRALDKSVREVASTAHYLTRAVEEVAGRAREIAGATREQEAELASIGEMMEVSRAAVDAIATSAREQLEAAREIRRQTEISGLLFQENQTAIGAVGEQAELLATTLATMQDLEARERAQLERSGQDAERLARQSDAVRREIERFRPHQGGRAVAAGTGGEGYRHRGEGDSA